MSRTHEVEGALKKVLEETDSVMTAISNTNNSFHQLANTQFIENRTYQDDADVARDEPDKQEKVRQLTLLSLDIVQNILYLICS